MSDTTITPMSAEGIKQLRDLLMYRNDVCGPGLAYFSPERALALIAAYDSAEARAETAEAERKKDLAHCKYEFERAEDAEAENTRLRAVLTAVEEIALAAPELNMNNYDEDQVSTLNEAMIGVCGILLKEAGRRAVADSEG